MRLAITQSPHPRLEGAANPPLARRALAHARARAADLFRIGFGLIWVIEPRSNGNQVSTGASWGW
jgi:hypothetical protein